MAASKPAGGPGTWQFIRKRGARAIFADAASFLKEAAGYFTWCDSHPLLRSEVARMRDSYDIAEVPVARPYTQEGLALFLGIGKFTLGKRLDDIRAREERGTLNPGDAEMRDAIEAVFAAIRAQHIEGGLAGLLHGGLVARLHGLTDKQEVRGDGVALNITVRDKDTADNIERLEDFL